MQEMLGLSTGPPPAIQKAAKLLPHPLYYLFVQIDALREAGGKSDQVSRTAEKVLWCCKGQLAYLKLMNAFCRDRLILID